MKRVFYKRSIATIACCLLLVTGRPAQAQYEIKWMSVGALHSWYSSIGCEIEQGRVLVQ